MAYPIKNKSLYIEINLLANRKSNKPICQKYFDKKLHSIFDLTIYYTSITFNDSAYTDRKWKMPSMYYEGLNEIFLLQPFDLNFFDPDQICHVYDRDQRVIFCRDTNTLVLVTHYYNGMQKGETTTQRTGAGITISEKTREWGAVSADENTELVNLIVDFSSVPIKDEKEGLFLKRPSAYLQIDQESEDKPIDFTMQSDRFYALSKKNIKKGEILKIKWNVNWENLTSVVGATLPSRLPYQPTFH